MILPRRDFLERALALSAAALTAGSTATQADEESKATGPRGPNDKLRVAVVGTSGRGGSHIGGWLLDTCTRPRYI